MTSTALTALTTQPGVAVAFVVVIEGYGYALTDGDPTGVLSALTNGLTGHQVADVFGGLSIEWDQREHIDPWKPIGESPALRFTVQPGPNSSGVIVDTFGRDVFKRTAASETYLTVDLDRNDTTVTVKSTANFAASGTAYVGAEAFSYSGKTGTTFTGVGRALYSPFQDEGGVALARTHRTFDPATETGDSVGVRLQPLVTSEPKNGLVGRQCGVWILTQVGSPTAYTDTSIAHLAFAGVIAECAENSAGATVVTVEDIRRSIYETPILRDQFRGKVREGIELVVGMANFTCDTWRDPTPGDATDLVVVSGAPGANEIQAGTYTAMELGAAIQSWLQAEKTAARILFHVRYSAAVSIDGGVRAIFEYEDPTITPGVARSAHLGFDPAVGRFLGWGNNVGQIVLTSAILRASTVSPGPPLRIVLTDGTFSGLRPLTIDNPSGTWIDQRTILPADLQLPGALSVITGVLRFGSLGYVLAARTSDTDFDYVTFGLSRFLPPPFAGVDVVYTVEDDPDLELSQVILAESDFKTLVLKILASTGTAGYNSATYDTLGDGISCGVPWSIMIDGAASVATDLDGIAESDRLCRMIVDKPTRFSDLFNVDLQLRWAFLTWAGGRLIMRAWSMPVAAYSTLALTEETKAVPAATASGDMQRSISSEDVESIANIVKVSYDRSPEGNYLSSFTVEDAPSMRDHGPRTLTLEARNGSPTDVRALVSAYCAGLPMFTRPRRTIRRTIRREDFETATVGKLVTITDRHIRAPDTGLRYDHTTGLGGLTGWPGIVVGHSFDWGGHDRDATGEIDVMIFDRIDHAPYSPCAQVDDTAGAPFLAGYEAGGPRFRCYAAEHSEAASVNDATQFVAGDEIVIVEIDPMVAASPTTWTRTVLSQSGDDIYITAAIAAPVWDAAKKYRIISAPYASAVATQITDSYQADDVDGLVVDVRQPYGMITSGAGQSSVFTLSPSTELPARYATLAVGDGKPYDTGYDRDIARGLNNLIDYKTTPQAPTIHEDADTFGGAGTYELVRTTPIWIGQGTMANYHTIKLAVAPMFASTDGSTATVRITLSKFPPEGEDRDDVLFPEPYVQASFTATAVTYAIATAQDLDTRHINRSEGLLGGFGFLSIEITNKTTVIGVGHCLVGPRVTP